MSRRLLLDVHTHLYLPRYANLLRSRSAVPRILKQQSNEERLLILNHEPSGGRPVGPQYWERDEKLRFMNKHGIDVSVISSANPWLDFLPAREAETLAQELNADLEEYCVDAPSLPEPHSNLKRLYGFGLLPLVPQIDPSSVVKAVHQIASLPHLKGVIMGTRGVGKGLDDEELEPVWEALAKTGLVVFLHPHYGVDSQAWGERENGHVLPLALGFPFETTVATTRLILSGVLDRHPKLRILLAHSGGTLPALSSRLASCIQHDPLVASRLKHDARYYLGQLYFDAVAYGSEELSFVSEVISRAHLFKDPSASASASTGLIDRTSGSERIMFGTDHPFFPPINASDKWKSVVENLEAIDGVSNWTEEQKAGVRGANALKLFNLV